jgi:uncharacterized membrane protein YeaQ/YmgE (transglycosylase-associated protein family)
MELGLLLLVVLGLLIAGVMMGAIMKLVSAVITGLVIGFLARLAMPGHREIGLVRTIAYGVVGSMAGGALAGLLHMHTWGLRLLLQIGVAAALVAVTNNNRLRGP